MATRAVPDVRSASELGLSYLKFLRIGAFSFIDRTLIGLPKVVFLIRPRGCNFIDFLQST